jgi:hypothetical protein
MPIFEIETPQGKFQVEAPDEQTAIQALQPQKEAGQPAPVAAPSKPKLEPWFPSLTAATEGSFAGVMGGFDDEIGAAMLSPFEAGIDWAKGDGFDMGRAYTRKQQELDARKAARRSDHPIASIGGELAGGLALGGGASKAGLTLAGKATSIPGAIATGAAEGAGYGALYGAGEAKPGERLAGAGTGAAIGGVTGGVLGGIGGAMSNRGRQAATGPSADDLNTAANQLYRASEQEGVRFNAQATSKLGNNLKLAAGEINEKLRPLTSGTVDDIDKMLKGEMTLKQIDEFRQGIGMDLKAAKGQDKMFLQRMKQMVDGFLDNAGPQDMTGGAKGVGILKEARRTWAQAKKAEVVENILDMADVKTGKYTQSGLANAVKQEMQALYKAIQKGKEKGWTKEEIALIRQMAKGGSPSSVVNLLAKFAPRGVVSFGAGQVVGSMIPGAGNILLPLGGEVAARAADRGAMQAAQSLRTAAATGGATDDAPAPAEQACPAHSRKCCTQYGNWPVTSRVTIGPTTRPAKNRIRVCLALKPQNGSRASVLRYSEDSRSNCLSNFFTQQPPSFAVIRKGSQRL